MAKNKRLNSMQFVVNGFAINVTTFDGEYLNVGVMNMTGAMVLFDYCGIQAITLLGSVSPVTLANVINACAHTNNKEIRIKIP